MAPGRLRCSCGAEFLDTEPVCPDCGGEAVVAEPDHLIRERAEADQALGVAWIDQELAAASAHGEHSAIVRAQLLRGDAILAVPPKEPLIEGVIDRGDFVCMFGAPASGKTFIALDLAGCVASGTWWHGAQVTAGVVVYVIAEGAPGIPTRWSAWKHRNGIHSAVEDLVWLPMRVNLRAAHWASAVAEVATELSAVLVVVDTIARTFGGGDENSSVDMGKYVAGLDTIRETSRAAVLAAHHSGKDAGAGARGHSSLLGAVDVELVVRNAGDGIITLENSKAKDRGLSAPRRFVLEPHLDSMAIAPYRGQDRSENLTTKAAAVLECLERIATDQGVAMTAWRDMASENGVGRSTFYEARKLLLDRGLVRTLGSDERGPFAPVLPGQDGEDS
jgi:hypothetical protein